MSFRITRYKSIINHYFRVTKAAKAMKLDSIITLLLVSLVAAAAAGGGGDRVEGNLRGYRFRDELVDLQGEEEYLDDMEDGLEAPDDERELKKVRCCFRSRFVRLGFQFSDRSPVSLTSCFSQNECTNRGAKCGARGTSLSGRGYAEG